MQENILVSAIITTRNEEGHIENCLRSVKEQIAYVAQTEIIVVDNNSTDGTKAIAAQYTDKVFNHGPERSAQRNFGAQKSKGEYLLFLDADMILVGDLISKCFQKCESDGLASLYIPEEIIGEGFWIRVRNFERSFYNGTVIDAVRFIKKEKFLEIGGFDESLTGPEDWDFDRRIKQVGEVGIVNSALYHNEGRFHLGRYLRKKAYYSRSLEGYMLKWGRGDSTIKKQLGFSYRYFGVFAENKKLYRLLFHPLLASSMYLLRGLVGLTYILEFKKDKK